MARGCVNKLRSLLSTVLPTFLNCAKEHPRVGYNDHKFFLYLSECIITLKVELHDRNPESDRWAGDDKIQKTLQLILNGLEGYLPHSLDPPPDWWLFFKPKSAGYRRLEELERRVLEKRKDGLDQIPVIKLEDIRFPDGESERDQLLEHFEQAIELFSEPQPEKRLPRRVKFARYPWKHVGDLSAILFARLRENWTCKCQHHLNREVHISLTEFRKFALQQDQESESESESEAEFQIVFPTSPDSQDFDLQNVHVTVEAQQLRPRDSKPRHDSEPIERNLCRVVEDAARSLGTRLTMKVSDKGFRGLRMSLEETDFFKFRLGKLVPLEKIIQMRPTCQGFSCPSMEGKNQLILSFVLATSALQLHDGPWLQQGLSVKSLNFLGHGASILDVRKPYLTTACQNRDSSSPGLDLGNPHAWPSILSLGIVLLEISCGDVLHLGDARKPDVVSANDRLSVWDEERKKDKSKTIPDGLSRAISSCINPKRLEEKHINHKSTPSSQVREYIFDEVVVPLGKALLDTYHIDPNKLHTELANPIQYSKQEQAGFDHYVDGNLKKLQDTVHWFNDLQLNGIHEFVFGLQDSMKKRKKSVAPVQIAILDTGLDTTRDLGLDMEAICNHKPGSPQSTASGMLDWNEDKDGHGTKVAQILLRVLRAAGLAEVHIFRVFETRQDLVNTEIAKQVHQRVANAIFLASKQGVDIIVMSFGFEKRIDSIDDAIERVSKNETPPLFFAATGNHGANQDTAWPASKSNVFGISSTDALGVRSPFNPPDGRSDSIFYALGEGFSSRALSYDRYDLSRPSDGISGTSYATPVAAGLAAILLGCVRMAVRLAPEDDLKRYKQLPQNLKRMGGMKKVLQDHMSRAANAGNKSLLPLTFFNEARDYGNSWLNKIHRTLDKT